MKKFIIFITLIFSVLSAESLVDLFKKHEEKVSDKWQNYLYVYENLFSPFRDKKISLLEIGVQNGGSLEIWKKYLGKNSKIVGVDIDPNIEKLEFSDDINVFSVDATNKEQTEKVLKDRVFDIIIDDGSHLVEDVIKSFEFLFERLSPGGIYVIEDIHTSYWKSHHGGFNIGSVEYFKKIIDVINSDFFETADQKKLDNFSNIDYLKVWVESISFENGMIIIKKHKNQKSTPYKRVMTGKKFPIYKPEDSLTKEWFDNAKKLES